MVITVTHYDQAVMIIGIRCNDKLYHYLHIPTYKAKYKIEYMCLKLVMFSVSLGMLLIVRNEARCKPGMKFHYSIEITRKS